MDGDPVETASMFRKMDNAGYNKDPEKGTELVEKNQNIDKEAGKKTAQPSVAIASSNGVPSTSYATTCRPEVCQAARSRFSPPNLSGSPWNARKSIFLGVTVGALVLWIIIYSTLSKLDLL